MGNYTDGAAVYQLLLDLNVGPPARFTVAMTEDVVNGLEMEIDAILAAQGYAPIPATAAQDVTLLGQMVRKKAAVQVYLTLQQPTRAPDWCRMWDIDWDEFLKRLARGQMRLPGQVPTAALEREIVIGQTLRVLPAEEDA